MPKRLMVLVAMLAVVLGTLTAPAMAESEPYWTGVIEKPEATTYMYGTHALTDATPDASYALQSDTVDLDAYIGERVSVYGDLVPGYEDGQVEGGPPLLNVTRVESSSPAPCPEDQYGQGDQYCPPPGPPPGEDFATLTFELAVEGTPPDDATFFGNVRMGEGGPGAFVPLTDPDDDGLYTGTTTAPRFGPGPRPVPPGVEPLSFGVGIVQGTGTSGEIPGQPITTIRDFGTVPMNDRTFSATVSFEDGTPDPTNPGTGVDGNGTVEEADEVSDPSGSGTGVLPNTGGPLPALLGASIALVAGGLLARRIVN